MDGLCLFSLTAQGIGKRLTRPPNHTKPNVISFYYSLFYFICFVSYFSLFLGAHTGRHACALRTGNCPPKSQNGINFTV